jgi:hypothetical protein
MATRVGDQNVVDVLRAQNAAEQHALAHVGRQRHDIGAAQIEHHVLHRLVHGVEPPHEADLERARQALIGALGIRQRIRVHGPDGAR